MTAEDRFAALKSKELFATRSKQNKQQLLLGVPFLPHRAASVPVLLLADMQGNAFV